MPPIIDHEMELNHNDWQEINSDEISQIGDVRVTLDSQISFIENYK